MTSALRILKSYSSAMYDKILRAALSHFVSVLSLPKTDDVVLRSYMA